MTSPTRIVVIGAGGHARELRWTIQCLPEYEFVGHVTSEPSYARGRILTATLGDNFNWLKEHRDRWDALALGIGSIAARKRIIEELHNYPWQTIIHPSAVYDVNSCRFGRGVFVSAGVVATVHAVFNDFAVANFGSVLGHEVTLGKNAVVQPRAGIMGGVSIGDNAMVGAGAVVREYQKVGDDAVVGAGAVVTKDVPAGQTWVGVPARRL